MPLSLGRLTRPWTSFRLVFGCLAALVVVCLLFLLSHSHSTVQVDWQATPSGWPSGEQQVARTSQHAHLALRSVPYRGERHQSDVVPWSAASLFSSPSHTLDIHPVAAALNDSAPDPSQLLFAFTTTSKRALEYHPLWQHFLRHGSHCIIVLPPEARIERNAMQVALGEQCRVRVSRRSRYEDRVGSVVQEAVRAAQGLADVRWLIIGDDDTNWIDFRVLRRMLSKYEDTGDHFIGGITEAEAQWGAFHRQAYGGAGIAISMPLVRKMAERFEDCLLVVKGVWTGGDGVLTYCAALIKNQTHSDVLQEEKGLHQMDVPGDGTGFFQAGLPFVTVHHYIDGWTDFFPKYCGLPSSMTDDKPAIALITESVDLHGGDNLFSRYVFDSGHILVTLGYSVSHFPEALTPADLTKMEYTWSYDGYDMRFPQRNNTPEGTDKTTYYLERTDATAHRQIFLSCGGERVELTYDWLDASASVPSEAGDLD